MCSEDQEKLIIDEVRRHYSNQQAPYYLAELGNYYRSHNIEVPKGVRFKDFLKSRFQGRLLVLQNTDVPAKIAIAPPEERERVLQQLTERPSEIPGDQEIDFARLPVALTAAFCIMPISGDQVYFRTVRPFRYMTGSAAPSAAPDDTYIEIEERFRPSTLRGMSVRNLTSEEKREIYSHIKEWATTKGIDLRTLYYDTGVESVRRTGRPTALTANALQRLIEAQEPELRKRVQIPADIAIVLMGLP